MKQAKWIWHHQKDYRAHNRTIIARKSFRTAPVKKASLSITADSYYRLFINGMWVNDGPGRAWPEHYQYDVIDVTSYLQPGENEIVVIARYYGVGTFHQVPQQAGLLAELTLTDKKRKKTVWATDASWEVAPAAAWIANTPKISIQMEPFESYDARRGGALRFEKATVLYDHNKGPWKRLHARDSALLTKEPVTFVRFLEANRIKRDGLGFCFPTARLLRPEVVEANYHVSLGSLVATIIRSPRARTVRIRAFQYHLRINGKEGKEGIFTLKAGDNFLLAAVWPCFGHPHKDTWIQFEDSEGLSFQNPLYPKNANPWCFTPVPEGNYVGTDIRWINQPERKRDTVAKKYKDTIETFLATVTHPEAYAQTLGKGTNPIPAEAMLMEDPHGQFVARNLMWTASENVHHPEALIYDNPQTTEVFPDPSGDIELVYDLGVQRCGYYTFELMAEAGVVVDILGIEYITPNGRLQHTIDNRNGMRYVCKQGFNTYTSLKRRSGRYLYITLRNVHHPVSIRKIQVIESTYPVASRGSFACSDPALERIWEISARTLKLCMEDTFTDCPLYEQTHWVGDARNESIFAYTAFGADDLARRCIRLTGQSLGRYPLAGCQVPSAWDCLLPAWSFLWGISVWDYYFYSGDTAFLREVWPWVCKNLDGAAACTDARGLFSGPFWNLFDWAGIDDGHETVLHNSMFVVGAIDAAIKCATVLGEKKTKQNLAAWRQRLINAINATWDTQRGAYPDSLHEDGTVSPQICQHTSFLSYLYGIVDPKNEATVLANMIKPKPDMTPIGSPFAIMYLYEALEKARQPEAILDSIRKSYKAMIDLGATTVWEVFGNSNISSDEFPTRSHCHAWSSAPIHFLNRIVLGIQQTAPGGTAYLISPWVKDLSWAKGTTAGKQGSITVSWRKTGRKLLVEASAPKGVTLQFIPNPSMDKYEVAFSME